MLYANPGDVRWLVSPFPVSPLGQSLALGPDGTLYGGSVMALNASTGSRKWQASYSSTSDIVVGSGPTLYFTTDRGGVHALHAQSGALAWEFDPGDWCFGAPALCGGFLYMTSGTNLYALDEAGGSLKWAFSRGLTLRAGPVAGPEGLVYIGTEAPDLSFYAVDGRTGALKWEFHGSGMVNAPAAIGADGNVYFGAGMSVYALDRLTGLMKWEFPSGGRTVWSPVIGVDGTIYIPSMITPASNAGALFALDNRDGSMKWRLYTGWTIASTPVVGPDGTLYFNAGAENNVSMLVAIDPATGRIKWTHTLGGDAFFSPVLGPNGLIYVMGKGDPYPDGFLAAIEGDSAQGQVASSWPQVHGNCRNTGHTGPPAFASPLRPTILPQGSSFQWMAPLDVENPPSNLQWLRDGYPLPNATQPSLEFSSLKPENEGTYTVVATNCFGATTNGPVPLVVNNVVTSTYFLLGFQGVPGSQVTLEASSDLSSAQNWRSFTNLSLLTSTSTWVDTATTDFQQRFFRADRPLKTVGSLPGWELNQPMGTRQRIDYVDSYTGITNWQWLTNVTLTSTPALFIDVTATNGLRRYYRTLPLP